METQAQTWMEVADEATFAVVNAALGAGPFLDRTILQQVVVNLRAVLIDFGITEPSDRIDF